MGVPCKEEIPVEENFVAFKSANTKEDENKR